MRQSCNQILKQAARIEGLLSEDLLIFFASLDEEKFNDQNEHLIKEDDAELILKMILKRSPRSENLCVFLQGSGGKISEAFKIARYLREK